MLRQINLAFRIDFWQLVELSVINCRGDTYATFTVLKIVNHFPLCHNNHHEPENIKMHIIIHNSAIS